MDAHCRASGHLCSVQVEEGTTNKNLITDVDHDLMGEVAAGIDWPGTYVFVLPSTNEVATSMSKLEKTEVWIELRDGIKERRVILIQTR